MLYSETEEKIVITEKDIKEMKVHSVIDLLNQIPGVRATKNSVNIRGFGSKEVLVLLDGRPLNDPYSRSINLESISINDIEKIVIEKGSGALKYGANVTGGVILIFTKEVKKKTTAHIDISYGKFNTLKGEFNLRCPLKIVDVLFSLKSTKTDGFRKNGWGKNFGTAIKLKKNKFTLSTQYTILNEGYPGRIYSPTPRARSKRDNLGIVFLANFDNLKSRSYFDYFYKSYKNPDISLDKNMICYVLGQSLQITSPFNIGIDSNLNIVKGKDIKSHREGDFALYGSKDWSFLGINFNFGLRADWHSELGLTIDPQFKLNGRFLPVEFELFINRSHNYPTFYQRFYETTFMKGNPNLDMEKAWNYKLCLFSKINKLFQPSLTFFYSNIKDRITAIKGNDGIIRYKNLSSTSKKGIETTINSEIFSFLSFNISYIYLIAKDERTGKLLPYQAKHQIQSNLYLKLTPDLTATFHGYYVSKRFCKPEEKEPLSPYFVLDAKIAFKLKDWEAYIEIDNLLDRYYEPRDGYPAPGITYTFGIMREF